MFWLLFALLTFGLSTPVYSQDVTPSTIPTPTTDPIRTLISQYENDYRYLYDQYQKSYLNYTDKKQVHTKYGTLTTEKEKIEATKQVLIDRNKMFKAYLMFVRVSLDKFKTTNSTETAKVQIDLSKWESWFEEQSLIVGSLNNQEDIQNWATNFKTSYIQIQQVIYTAITQSEINQRQTTLETTKKLAERIQSDPALSDEGRQWFSDLPVKTDLVSSSLKNAFEETQKKQNNNKFNDFYSQAHANIIRADKYLNDIYSDLKSVVTKFLQN